MTNKNGTANDGRIGTFVQGYDNLLGGGIPKGSVVLIRGGTGTMKSSLAYYILYENARRGRLGLYATVEQGADAFYDQMRTLDLEPESVSKPLAVLDLSRGREYMEKLRDEMAESKRSSGGFVTLLQRKMEQVREKHPFELLAIDSWDALGIILEFEDRRSQTFDFFRWLRGLGITSFLVSESWPDPAPDDFSEEFLADAIFALKNERISELDFQRRIQCVKMRSSAHSADFYTLVFENGRFEVAKAIA